MRRCQLLDPRGEGVPDPLGGSLAHYEQCAAQIESHLRARLDGWA